MLSISLEDTQCKTLTDFLEELILESEKAAKKSCRYTIIKTESNTLCYELVTPKLSQATYAAEKDLVSFSWKIYRDLTYLEYAVRGQKALNRIREQDVFTRSITENIYMTCIDWLGLTACVPQVNIGNMLVKLEERIEIAFTRLEKAKTKFIHCYNDQMKEQLELSTATYSLAMSKGKKAFLKVHPDKNLENLQDSHNETLKFMKYYSKLKDTLLNYGITAAKMDELSAGK
ncbi:MAG: hypothetical protein WC222_00690 [Parachlamydiales bacterium]|jgi:hypothetical protein